MSKHSPAPWKILVGGGKHIYSSDMMRVTRIEEQNKQCEGNAKLIAAAPELLAQLKEAITIIRVWHGMGMLAGDQEERMWDIYWNMSPEMKPIRELLEKFL